MPGALAGPALGHFPRILQELPIDFQKKLL
jgi:hypothetical protein